MTVPSNSDAAIDKLLCEGTIAEIDLDAHLVRVQHGGITTNWIRWFGTYSGDLIDWGDPTVGEAGMILSPSGDMLNGVFLRGIYSDQFTPPSTDKNTWKLKFRNGDTIEHKDDDYTIKITGNIDISCKGDAKLKVEGNLDADITGTTHIKGTGMLTIQSVAPMLIKSDSTLTLQGSSSTLVL